MYNSIFKYLIESSIYLGFFLLIYKWSISNLTHFTWMRVYLLSSLVLSVVLPLIVLPNQWSATIFGNPEPGSSLSFPVLIPNGSDVPGIMDPGYQTHQSLNIPGVLVFAITAIYLIGAAYKLSTLFRSLLRIRKNVKHPGKQKEGRFWIINHRDEVPASSFLNFIFINSDDGRLTQNDLQVIKDHELLHARQYHSIDTLLVEMYSVVFWFNPFVKYLKNRIVEVHEYLADEKMCPNNSSKKEYSNLLLGLTCEIKTCGLTSGFSGKQICRRVQMLAKSRSGNYSKLSFSIILPVAVFLLLSFSYFDPNELTNTQTLDPQKQTELIGVKKIGKIAWEGNKMYNVSQLNRALGLKKGDLFTKEILENRLRQADDGILSLYMEGVSLL